MDEDWENMYDEGDFDEEFETGKIIRKVSNGEESAYFTEREGGIWCSDGTYICPADDEEMEDKIGEYAEAWRETHWNRSDWADHYGCDEDQLDDAMDDDMRGW
jgi:hypothetical protein